MITEANLEIDFKIKPTNIPLAKEAIAVVDFVEAHSSEIFIGFLIVAVLVGLFVSADGGITLPGVGASLGALCSQIKLVM